MKRIILVLFLIIALSSCTDATIAGLKSFGEPHHIRMYNGGILVAEWVSTGKVESLSQSDGWQFMDSKTRKLVRVGGDIIIEVKE